MADYEVEYKKARGICGQPSEEIRSFFESSTPEGARVLDLGCGQERDTLLAARLGDRVTRVDSTPTGVKQVVAETLDEVC